MNFKMFGNIFRNFHNFFFWIYLHPRCYYMYDVYAHNKVSQDTKKKNEIKRNIYRNISPICTVTCCFEDIFNVSFCGLKSVSKNYDSACWFDRERVQKLDKILTHLSSLYNTFCGFEMWKIRKFLCNKYQKFLFEK